MQRKRTASFALTALVLSITACSSGGSDGGNNVTPNGNVIAPVVNGPTTPFSPVTDTDNPAVPGAVEGSTPVVPLPGNPEPTTPVVPVNPSNPQADNSLPREFYNGAFATQQASVWQCRQAGSTGAGNFYNLQFFEDATGAYADDSNHVPFEWLANDNSVSFSFAGSSANITLADIRFTSTSQFLTTVQVTDQPDEATQCDLFSLGDDTTEPGTTPTDPTTQPSADNGTVAAMLSNGRESGDLQSSWICFVTDSTVLAWAFFDDNSGIVADSEEGFYIRWDLTTNSDVAFSFTENSSVSGLITAPDFQSDNVFQSDELTIDGEPLGSMYCERTTV